jgi:hypothetical protein
MNRTSRWVRTAAVLMTASVTVSGLAGNTPAAAAQAKSDETVRAARTASVQNLCRQLKEAKSKLSQLEKQAAAYNRGSIGFFETMKKEGSADAGQALDLLKTAKYRDKIRTTAQGASVQQASVDATSLRNMQKTFQYMRYYNNLRRSLGLSELKVSHTLMAAAQADADYSDTVIGHALQFDYGENVAWNYGSNPFFQWYDGEKAEFDRAARSLGQKETLTGKAAYDYYQEHRAEINSKVKTDKQQIGHYINDIDPYGKVMGFAITDRGSIYGWTTYVRVYAVEEGAETYTVDAYEAMLNQYVRKLSASIQTYNNQKKKVAALEKKVSRAANFKLKGSTASQAENLLSVMKSTGDFQDAAYLPMRTYARHTGKTLKLSWKKVRGAKKYVVYAGTPNGTYVRAKTTAGTSAVVKKLSGKKIKKGTCKAAVLAYNKKGKVIAVSQTVFTGGSNKTIRVKTTKLRMRRGRSYRLKASSGQSKKYRSLRYVSTNKKVAAVSSSGKIRAGKRGTTYVYIYAQDGYSKKVKVQVK